MSQTLSEAAFIGILGALFYLSHQKRVESHSGLLTRDQVKHVAGNIVKKHNFVNVQPCMVATIAEIESNFDPLAVRVEASKHDVSIGLMQTLKTTAQWLAKDMGFDAYGVPSEQDLLNPVISIYFGAAYLQYLSKYKGYSRTREWIVRSYNGGPGHSQAATNHYWQKYLNKGGC